MLINIFHRTQLYGKLFFMAWLSHDLEVFQLRKFESNAKFFIFALILYVYEQVMGLRKCL